MKRLFKTLHLWLSLPAGVFIVLLCLTGAILTFQQEIQLLVNPGFYKVPEYGNVRLPLDSLARCVEKQTVSSGHSLESVTYYADSSRTVGFGISGKKGVFYTINPYSSEITGCGQPGGTFFTSVRGLHRWLLLDNDLRSVGRVIMGISTLFLLVILISGAAVSLPKSFSNAKNVLSIRRGRDSFLLWFTSHRTLGIYCAVFLFLMAVTGPMWTFSWYRSGVAKIFGTEMQARERSRQHQSEGRERKGESKNMSTNYARWSRAVAEIGVLEPTYQSISISGDKASVKTASHHQRASDIYKLDNEGHVTDIEYYSRQPVSNKIMGYAFIIHTGLWGGVFVKLLYLLACIGGVYLVVSGYVLYIRRVCRVSPKKSEVVV